MNIIKAYSRRSFLWIFVLILLFAGTPLAAIYFGKPFLVQKISLLATSDISPSALSAWVNQLHNTYAVHLIALFAGVMFLWMMILWLVLRRMAKRLLTHAETTKTKPQKTKPAKDSSQKKKNRQKLENQRLFLHLLIVLQREGRLIDFLQEDLDAYEDEQIGAAVRNIHSNCQKIINKSLSMKPIANGSEGDEISVETGFDPDAIKLTGRVTGEPPFTGIIRHRGWRAQKLELPDLSAVKDPTIISPAEIEIE